MAQELDGTEIAIVGLAGRFPGAGDLDRFWHNLEKGVDAFHRHAPEDLVAAGLSREEAGDKAWVPVSADLEGSASFDAAFFGYSHREAELLDPQQRVLLELAWQAMEHAGYDAAAFPGAVGVFAGATTSTYLLYNLMRNPEVLAGTDPLQLLVANAADSLATRIAYKLDLRGPAFTVQCACSTSLVAVHLACQALLDEHCDMALAGGISINVRNRFGYRWQQGSILSPDGRCRAFDSEANGTVFGNGGALVVLRRAEDALRDGDTIHALIRATAVNNDGAHKVGYTAPSVDGQADVIAEALGASGVEADSIQYLEAHGTATALGDPIEIQALTKAYSTYTERKQFCALGTVKSNIGHLDVAAGIAGLVKMVLALENKRLPPTLHNNADHPKIDFAQSPVYLLREAKDWPRLATPRRAALSSFGFGGTNAHAILEEAPPAAARAKSAGPWLFPLSARSPAALAVAATRLALHLEAQSAKIADGELELGDVAFTLQRGRRHFSQRRAIVAASLEELLAALRDGTEPGDASLGDSQLHLTARRFAAGETLGDAALQRGRRLPLPGYPFERKRYFIEAPRAGELAASGQAAPEAAAQVLHARSLATPYVAPRGELEKKLAELWGRALGVDKVGSSDNFFELGGDSFIAVQVIQKVREELGRDVPVTTLYEGLTIGALARLLATAEAPAAAEKVAELAQSRDRRREFLSDQRGKKRDLSFLRLGDEK